MASPSDSTTSTIPRDLTAGLVVFFVALPLCLGVALASGAPSLSGVLSGIIGGILVGLLSRSHTSVSGPAAGLAAIVAVQIGALGFPAFLLAVIIAGFVQIGLGIARAGFFADFFPSSVIKGLLAAIGVLLILKQIPHLFGHDADPEGDMSFLQQDQSNTFLELFDTIDDIHLGASIIGLGSIAILMLWGYFKPLKKSVIPAPLVVVVFGVGISEWFGHLGGRWVVASDNFVLVPVADSLSGFFGLLQWPDFRQWNNPAVYVAGLTIAAVASLETLLNLEAVDKLDPRRRTSPPSRELWAQGVGNVAAGLIGGIPVTSVIVRSSVNINAGGRTKFATIVHGLLLLVSVLLLPQWLNKIPLACLAAILLVTGVKLASPKLLRTMWKQGVYQFVPFAATVVAIVLTDLLVGVVIGLAVALSFILNSNMRRPIRVVVEKHLGVDVLHIELANQVSFLNRAALLKVLEAAAPGSQVLIDARNTDYIDPDVLDLLRDYTDTTAPARGVEVSLVGFRTKYQFENRLQYVDHSTRELQSRLTPDQVLNILKDGNERFRTGNHLSRDFGRQVHATAAGQHPLAVVFSCIDSRSPSELVFDVGLGDILSIRVAGNVLNAEVLGSMEYGCSVEGAKLILVMGHTRCGAVTAAVAPGRASDDGCVASHVGHMGPILDAIRKSIDPVESSRLAPLPAPETERFIDEAARRNVVFMARQVLERSPVLEQLRRDGGVEVVGAMYDVVTGSIEFLSSEETALAGT